MRAEALQHDPTGNFSSSIMSLWLCHHTNTYLLDVLRIGRDDRDDHLLADLAAKRRDFGAKAFIAQVSGSNTGGHFFTLLSVCTTEAPTGGWYILDSLHAAKGLEPKLVTSLATLKKLYPGWNIVLSCAQTLPTSYVDHDGLLQPYKLALPFLNTMHSVVGLFGVSQTHAPNK
jgi:hypothetical protein